MLSLITCLGTYGYYDVITDDFGAINRLMVIHVMTVNRPDAIKGKVY